MKIVKANNPLWKASGIDWGRVMVPPEAEVEIHLGTNPAFDRQLVGDGNVACWCVGRDSDGKIPSMACSPGFVLRLGSDDLLKVGFTRAEISLSQGANSGDYLDPENGRPVCGECLLATGFYLLSEDDRREEGDERSVAQENRQNEQVCWSCAQMIAEPNLGEVGEH